MLTSAAEEFTPPRALDGDHFRERADAEHDVDLDRRTDGHRHGRALERRKSLELELELIHTRRQRGKSVRAGTELVMVGAPGRPAPRMVTVTPGERALSSVILPMISPVVCWRSRRRQCEQQQERVRNAKLSWVLSSSSIDDGSGSRDARRATPRDVFAQERARHAPRSTSCEKPARSLTVVDAARRARALLRGGLRHSRSRLKRPSTKLLMVRACGPFRGARSPVGPLRAARVTAECVQKCLTVRTREQKCPTVRARHR